MPKLTFAHESWPVRGAFTISRGSRTTAEVVVVTLTDGGHTGRGECVPYARYNETVANVIAEIKDRRAALEAGITPEDLQSLMPAGAARAAVDCAVLDLMAKQAGKRVWDLLGLTAPQPMVTAYTLSLGPPDDMADAARAAAQYPLLKMKLGSGDIALDTDRVAAVRAARPDARIIIDANEAWSMADLERAAEQLAALKVALIEQPLPAGDDAALDGFESPVPLCADESIHDTASLAPLIGRYAMINIKLNKTGGLTEALRLRAAARKAGLDIMVGCMLGTSLAMAPAMLVAAMQGGDGAVVDLDGPLLLARDREPGIRYDGATMHPPEPELWG